MKGYAQRDLQATASDITLDEPRTAFARRLDNIFAAIVADPEVFVGDIDLLAPEEHAQVLVDWNDTAHAVPQGTLVSLFDAQVERTPDAVALVFEQEELSYRELQERANRIARRLIADGVGPGDHVALAIRRSTELVVAMYAVLQAGAAYVPLDPDQPADRIGHIIETARPRLVLTSRRDAFETGGVTVHAVENLFSPADFSGAPITDGVKSTAPSGLSPWAHFSSVPASSGRAK